MSGSPSGGGVKKKEETSMLLPLVLFFNIGDSGHMVPMLDVAKGWVEHKIADCVFVGDQDCREKIEGYAGCRFRYYLDDPSYNLLEYSIKCCRETIKVEPFAEQSYKMPFATLPAAVGITDWILKTLIPQERKSRQEIIGQQQQQQPILLVYDGCCPWAWIASQQLRSDNVRGMCFMTASVSQNNPGFPETESSMAAVRMIQSKYPGVRLTMQDCYYAYHDTSNVLFTCTHLKQNDLPPQLTVTTLNTNCFFAGPAAVLLKPPTKALSCLHDKTATATSTEPQQDTVFLSMGTVYTQKGFVGAFGPALRAVYTVMARWALDHPAIQVIVSAGESCDLVREAQTQLSPDKPIPNLRFHSWTDQRSLLSSGKVLLACIHGGANSTWECITNTLPTVVIPMHGDQFMNGRFVEAHNFGRMVTVWKKVQHERGAKELGTADGLIPAIDDVLQRRKEIVESIETELKEYRELQLEPEQKLREMYEFAIRSVGPT